MIYVCDEISNFWVGDDGGNLKNQGFPFIYTFEIRFWKKINSIEISKKWNYSTYFRVFKSGLPKYKVKNSRG